LRIISCAHESKLADQNQNHGDILLKNITAIDAINGVRRQQSILIAGEKIVYVGEANTATANRVIDGSGKFLIPGLWDAHVHLTFEPALDDAMFNLLLANGITSVRDTGGQIDKVLAWKQKSKSSLAPDVYIAGPLIDGKPGVYLGNEPDFPAIGVETDSAEQVVALVDQLANSGVDLLKAYEMLSPRAYKALLERAAYHQLPVTGHVPLSMTPTQVSDQGLHSMEHLRNLEMECSSKADELFTQRRAMLLNPQNKPGSKLRSDIHKAQHFKGAVSLDEMRCNRLIATLVKNQTWQIPTLMLMAYLKYPYFADPQWLKTFEFLPEPLKSNWTEEARNYSVIVDWKMNMVKKFAKAGVPIMAGTDMPIFFLTPGYSLHKELEVLVLAGLSAMQAIEAATINPAKYFAKDHEMGSIDEDKVADLVLLNANPLTDISNTQAIEMVFRKGVTLSLRLFERKSLTLKATVNV